MYIKFNSIFTKTVLPIISVFGVGIIALILVISHITKQSTLDTAINNAKSTISQYEILRSYYTKNVVEKVKTKSNLLITFDHKIRKNAIPLPATVIHDLSSLLTDNRGIQLKLYSAFPFPNRNDRILDKFEQDALSHLANNPEDSFIRTELVRGKELVRVAVADKMVNESCVNCHNNHQQTPKKGWKIGDTRGVLEVVIPINDQLNANRNITFIIFFTIGLMFVIVLVTTLFSFRQNIAKPIKKFSNMSMKIAKGNFETKVDIKTNDEIGKLATSFNKMVDSLNETTTDLKRSNEELSDFAYIASHDLKEPLRKVYSFAGIMKDEYDNILEDTGKEYLKIMSNSCMRMQTLIDDLLEFAKITAKSKNFKPVNLKEIIMEVVTDLEKQIKETNGTINIGNFPIVKADPSQMRQLFQNLVSNALKYHRKDVPPQVKVDTKQYENQIEILVEDNGIGFDEKYKEKIFSLFQRLHGKHEKEYHGTGLGLAICKKIVERYKGNITAQSIPGVGSKFVITLPLIYCYADDNKAASI